MIRIIITATVFLLSLCAHAQTVVKEVAGTFNGKLCDIGRGLCTITPSNTNAKNTSMKNYTTYKKSNNELVMELDTETLSIADQIKFFGKEYSKIAAHEQLFFVQEADYEFSFDMLLYLDMDFRYKYLKKGEYPLEIIDHKVQITLTLTKE